MPTKGRSGDDGTVKEGVRRVGRQKGWRKQSALTYRVPMFRVTEETGNWLMTLAGSLGISIPDCLRLILSKAKKDGVNLEDVLHKD